MGRPAGGERVAAAGTVPATGWSQVRPLLAPSHTGGLARSATALAHVVVPALVATLLWRSGRTTMAVIVVVIAAGLGLATLSSARARAAIRLASAWLSKWIGRVVTTVVLTAVYFVLFAPVALILRLRGRIPLQLGYEPHRDTYWEPIVRPAIARRLYTRPFAYEPADDPRGRAERSWLGRLVRQTYAVYAAVAALVVANFAIGLALATPPDDALAGRLRGHQIPALRPYPWIPAWEDTFARHSANRFSFRPHVNWRHPDFASEWINSRGGIRKSYEPPGLGTHPVVVQFYGGSTIWGVHQRDLHTIPSELARIAESHGIPVKVVNYGQLGYSSVQEVALFSENCVAGVAADLAVFYNGYNDLGTVIQSDDVGVGEPPVRMRELMVADVYRRDDPVSWLVKYSAIHRWLAPRPATAAPEPPGRHGPADYLPRLERWYFGNARLAHQVGAGYGVKVFSFAQAHYGTKKPDPRELRPEELGPNYWKLWRRPDAHEVMAATARLVRDRLPDYMIDLGSALDDAPAPVMTDMVHHTELGAQLVAARIFEHIEPALRAAQRAREAQQP
jgi:hypothetical protein